MLESQDREKGLHSAQDHMRWQIGVWLTIRAVHQLSNLDLSERPKTDRSL